MKSYVASEFSVENVESAYNHSLVEGSTGNCDTPESMLSLIDKLVKDRGSIPLASTNFHATPA